MIFNTITLSVICLSIAQIKALEQCSGASDDSQDDLTWKYIMSSIVAYGTVSEVDGHTVIFQVSCVLKGQLLETTISLTQTSEVADSSECHYLTTTKNYIIFLEHSETVASDKNSSFQLANIEEIEVTQNSMAKFIHEECGDDDDYGLPMTILYTDNNSTCHQFTVICDENTKTSIPHLNYSLPSSTSTFVGGMKVSSEIPNLNDTENGMAFNVQSSGTDDEILRNTATDSIIPISTTILIVNLVMLFNYYTDNVSD